MTRLTEAEFKATFSAPMIRVGPDEDPACEFWSYVEGIPAEDFHGLDCSLGRVEHVYRDPSGRYEHVLIDSTVRDAFMVVVLDRQACAVHGHHALNLVEEYGGAL